MDKGRQCRNLFAQCQSCGSMGDQNIARTSWASRQKIRGGTEIPTNLKDIIPTPYFQQQSHYRLNSWRNEEATATSKVDSTTRRFSSRPQLTGNERCIYNRTCHWYETENQVPTPRTAEDEEQIDLEPEQLTWISQKQQTLPRARGDSLQQITENHETLIRKASQQAACARMTETR